MHIVIVRTALSYLDGKTYNRQETGLAKVLAKRGIRVSLIYAGREYGTEYVCENVAIYYLKCIKLNQQIGTFFHLWKMLDSLKPDMLQIHDVGMLMSYYSLKWAQRRKVKSVLIQGAYETTRKPFFKQMELFFGRTIGTYILRYVNGVGCKTPAAKEFLMNFYKREYYQTPIGLDDSRFKDKEQQGFGLREEFNIETDKKILLYIGVNEKRRHVETLVTALRCLSDKYVLVIVGSGPEKVKLEDITQKEVKGKRIFWLDKRPQEQLPLVYKDADLFLLASDYEIYGMVILEAMYYNVPVLSTMTGGARALINDNETGYLIDSFDGKLWAKKIEYIFSNQIQYHNIKMGLHDYVISNLLWDKVCDKFIDLYENI